MKKHTGLYVLVGVVGAGVLLRKRVMRAIDMAHVHSVERGLAAETPKAPPGTAGSQGAMSVRSSPVGSGGILAKDIAPQIANAVDIDNRATGGISTPAQLAASIVYGAVGTANTQLADRAAYVLKTAASFAPQASASQISSIATAIANVQPGLDPKSFASMVAQTAAAVPGQPAAPAYRHPIASLVRPGRAMASTTSSYRPASTAPVSLPAINLPRQAPPAAAPPPPAPPLPASPTDPGYAQQDQIYTDGQGNYYLADGTQIDPSMISVDQTTGQVYLSTPSAPSDSSAPPMMSDGFTTDAQGNVYGPDGSPQGFRVTPDGYFIDANNNIYAPDGTPMGQADASWG